eukprot:9999952-Alexandrium_andersonii.AAC.1
MAWPSKLRPPAGLVSSPQTGCLDLTRSLRTQVITRRRCGVHGRAKELTSAGSRQAHVPAIVL